jgi:hypothetical protein
MKALITLATLTLLAFPSFGAFSEGRVVYDACGENTVQPKNNWRRFAHITSVCKVTVLGMDLTTPVYTVEFVSNNNEYTTFLYSQVTYKPTPAKNTGRWKAATIGLQVIGTVENGLLNRIYFFKRPAIEKINALTDRRRNIVSLSGNLKLLGGGSGNYPLRVNNFEIINSTF